MKRIAFTLIAIGLGGAGIAPGAQATPKPPPLQIEAVDDRDLAGMSGKFMGATMLVGLRIELVSKVRTADGGTASASGALQIVQDGNGGFHVALDSRSHAGAGAGGTTPGGIASGGDGLQIDGIGQIVQIAGDGNAFSNLASITFTRDLGSTAGFNGLAESSSNAGQMTARVSFHGDGMALDLTGPGALLEQSMARGHGASSGRLMQLGQLSGDHISGGNLMHLSLLTQQVSAQALRQMGARVALSGLGGI